MDQLHGMQDRGQGKGRVRAKGRQNREVSYRRIRIGK